MLRVLDTDHISLFQRNHTQVVRRVRETASSDLAITIISVEEQMRGWLAAIRQASNSTQLIENYQRLASTVRYFNTIAVLPFNQKANHCYENFLSQRIRVGRQDLKIAAIAIAHDAVLVTRNRRDFSQVPGLQWESWATE